jgi:hypothetical protein
MVAARRFNHEPNLLLSLTADYVKLLWSTIADLPQSYHVVKALCISIERHNDTNCDTKYATSSFSS